MTQEKNKHQKYSKIYQSWPTAVFYQPAMWKLHFKAAARENRKFAIPRLRLGERGVTTSAADTFPVRSRGQQRLRMWKESDRASRFILPGVRPVQRQFPEKHWLEAIKVVADSTSGWMAFSFSNSTIAEGWGITFVMRAKHWTLHRSFRPNTTFFCILWLAWIICRWSTINFSPRCECCVEYVFLLLVLGGCCSFPEKSGSFSLFSIIVSRIKV